MTKFFHFIHQSQKSRARLGEITTDHGVIKTPAFVPVGTKGTIKTLLPSLIPEIGIQVAFVNTYHLVTHPGVEVIEQAGGIHSFSQLNIPLMSDSGGFQVFSLAKNDVRHHVLSPPHPKGFTLKVHPEGTQAIGLKMTSSLQQISSPVKHASRKADVRGEEEPLVVKISDDGVKFRSTFDGQLIEFTPETSMEYQRKIGADLNMAFDECTYYPATHDYTEKAMKRTHEWLRRCVDFKKNNARRNVFCPPHPKGFTLKVHPEGTQAIDKKIKSSHIQTINKKQSANNQYLYGIIQGGTFEDLRKKSAEFVVSQDVDGVAIGGVSVGETKKEMRDQVRWVADFLPKDKPVHLLGVGQIDDIIDLVKHGIDTFDCVEPTRLARMGVLYQMKDVQHHVFESASPQRGPKRLTQKQTFSPSIPIDISKSVYKNNLERLDDDCNCSVCTHFTKAYLHHLFKQREILGYNLATYHNLWVMERFMEKIREMIGRDMI